MLQPCLSPSLHFSFHSIHVHSFFSLTGVQTPREVTLFIKHAKNSTLRSPWFLSKDLLSGSDVLLALLSEQINASDLLCITVLGIPLFEKHWSLSAAWSCWYPSKTNIPSFFFLYNHQAAANLWGVHYPACWLWCLKMACLDSSPPFWGFCSPTALPVFILPSWPWLLDTLLPLITILRYYCPLVFLVFFPHLLFCRASSSVCPRVNPSLCFFYNSLTQVSSHGSFLLYNNVIPHQTHLKEWLRQLADAKIVLHGCLLCLSKARVLLTGLVSGATFWESPLDNKLILVILTSPANPNDCGFLTDRSLHLHIIGYQHIYDT